MATPMVVIAEIITIRAIFDSQFLMRLFLSYNSRHIGCSGWHAPPIKKINMISTPGFFIAPLIMLYFALDDTKRAPPSSEFSLW